MFFHRLHTSVGISSCEKSGCLLQVITAHRRLNAEVLEFKVFTAKISSENIQSNLSTVELVSALVSVAAVSIDKKWSFLCFKTVTLSHVC